MSYLDCAISSLPLIVTNVIRSYLPLPEAINACLNIPRWNRMLYEKSTREELDSYISSMTWFDKNICNFILKAPSSSVYDVCSTILYHHKQSAYLNSKLDNLPSLVAKNALRCLVTGPAVDNLGCLDQFYNILFEASFNLTPRVANTSSTRGWTANGVPVRIPIGSAEVVLDVSTLHARTRSQRANVTSRIAESLILDMNGLKNNARVLISSNDFIFYMIDCRPGHSNWDEVCFELDHVCRSLSSEQSLFVVGVVDAGSNRHDCLCEMTQILCDETNGPLKETPAKWRLLSFQKGDETLLSIAEIFKWACCDAASKHEVEERVKPASWFSALLSSWV